MIISSTNLLIFIIALAAVSVTIGIVVRHLGHRRGPGLAHGARDAGSLLTWSHAPRGSSLGNWYLELESDEVLATPTLRFLTARRSPASSSPTHIPYSLAPLHDGRKQRRLWAAVKSKGPIAVHS